jgi:hypothetical protein
MKHCFSAPHAAVVIKHWMTMLFDRSLPGDIFYVLPKNGVNNENQQHKPSLAYVSLRHSGKCDKISGFNGILSDQDQQFAQICTCKKGRI